MDIEGDIKSWKHFHYWEKKATNGATLRYLSCLNSNNVILSFASAGQQYTHPDE